MASFTPGPWEVESWRSGFAANVAIVGSDRSSGGTCTVCWIGANRTSGENEANARLIAAAPDLLAACEALVSWIATKPSDLIWEQEKESEQPAFDQAVGAIRKARGQS